MDYYTPSHGPNKRKLRTRKIQRPKPRPHPYPHHSDSNPGREYPPPLSTRRGRKDPLSINTNFRRSASNDTEFQDGDPLEYVPDLPESPRRPSFRQTIKNWPYTFAIILLIAYFGISVIASPFMGYRSERAEKAIAAKGEPITLEHPQTPKVQSTVSAAQVLDETPRVPLGLFDDYSALYRNWAQFSTLRPAMPRFQDISKDHVHILPVFAELYAFGDMWDRVTGEFSNASDTDDAMLSSRHHQGGADGIAIDRSNATHIDLTHLERSIAKGMNSAGVGFVHAAQGFRDSQSWFKILKGRFQELRDSAREDIRVEPIQPQEPSQTPRRRVKQPPYLPPHAEPIKQLRAARKISPSGALSPRVDAREAFGKHVNPGVSLIKVLEQLETLQSIAAQASTQQLIDTTNHKGWVEFRLLGRISMLWSRDSPLLKAVKQAMGVSVVAGERVKLTEMTQKVNALVNTLGPIVRCKVALDAQLEMLLAAAGEWFEHKYAGEEPYHWVPEHQAWLITRPKLPGKIKDGSEFASPRGLEACAPLRYDSSFQNQPYELNGQDTKTERVMVYVPAAKYIYEMFDQDFQWIRALEPKAN